VLVIVTVMAAAIAALIYLRVFAPVPVLAHRVERGDVVRQAFGRGTIESDREAQLGFDLVGRLSDVLVDEGDRVSLGQELARLQPDQARADLRTAASGVAAARTSLQRLAAEERKARALFEAAEREQRRSRELLAKSAIAQRELDISEDATRVARAELDRVLAQRVEATRSVDVAQGGASQREVAVLRATLLAPFDGIVTRRLREPGDTVRSVVPCCGSSHRPVFVSAWLDERARRAARSARADRRSVASSPTAWSSGSAGIRSPDARAGRRIAPAVARRIAIGNAPTCGSRPGQAGVIRLPIALLQRDREGAFVHVDGRISRPRERRRGQAQRWDPRRFA
jgi:HlyD family secretion protein